MELGVAGSIAVKYISGGDIGKAINKWLEMNPDTEVIDIKFAASANEMDWTTDALIIYRKED
ncbi:hypothetical protein [Shouchella clausii]|uniref:hypothetical protein n=1 Tax=Shouchella clausii TaxID=79880 RepID=UPI000B962D4D|nr:hypothetical protein [Shouchella clausii]AST97316.1 hypothetical protein BC8716_15680 [Shouchella clausii]MBU8597278.1 hypothetical protein [Shouchella clausii]MCR1287876.1 hypothetical protein [Shouchella clausii]MCY1106472.1 hypothetical protein [Shouchella clausii]MEB5473222.1 hypothetical protein [Shouchella clausii]